MMDRYLTCCDGQSAVRTIDRHTFAPGRSVTSYTSDGIAYDREGPRGELPVVLMHAGVADRRMWDPIWPTFTGERDVVRVDLRGFGDSAARPAGPVSPAGDVLGALAEISVGRCHLVGASFGAGVAVEVALTRPPAVASLLLAAPGGSLLAEVTPDLQAFFDAEGTALDRGDLDAAVEANLSCWVEGPRRSAGQVDSAVRELVARMQRRAFEVTADWDDVEEKELVPPAMDRLGEIVVPVLVLVGGLDLDAVHAAAARVAAETAGARRVDWLDSGHLPALEQPADFLDLLREWTAELRTRTRNDRSVAGPGGPRDSQPTCRTKKMKHRKADLSARTSGNSSRAPGAGWFADDRYPEADRGEGVGHRVQRPVPGLAAGLAVHDVNGKGWSTDTISRPPGLSTRRTSASAGPQSSR
jgi:3-oxoadipate enol-lactonase